ncbi:MAG: SDR family oxidoreductase [Desulfobacterales bacterium]
MNQNWVLILGASSDMARAAARSFAREGYNIYLASRNTQELDREARHLALKYGRKAKSLYFDALDTASHPGFYAGLEPRPAGALLAFGILGDQKEAQNDFSLARQVMYTNYVCAVSILEVIAADFEQRGEGFIAGISSVAGDRGRQSNYIYGSAKAGLSTYLSGLRHRLFKTGVHVLAVKPGFVATKMTAGLGLPEKLTAQPTEAGERIVKAVKKRKDTIYIKPIWRLIMCIIVCLPEFVFKRTGL